MAGGLYWGRRYVRAIEARTASDARIAELEARLSALEAHRPEAAAFERTATPVPEIGQRAAPRLPDPTEPHN